MNLNNIIKLSRILTKLESINTDCGVIVTEEPIAVGVKVYDEDGNPVPDGVYTTDTQVILVEGGIITEINALEKPEPETEEVVEEQAEVEPEGEEVSEESETDEKDEKIAELEAKIVEYETKIAELEAKIAEKDDELKSANEKLSAPIISEQKKEVKTPIFKSYLK